MKFIERFIQQLWVSLGVFLTQLLLIVAGVFIGAGNTNIGQFFIIIGVFLNFIIKEQNIEK